MVSPAQGDNCFTKKLKNVNNFNILKHFSSKMLKRENVVEIQGDFNIFNIFFRILDFENLRILEFIEF